MLAPLSRSPPRAPSRRAVSCNSCHGETQVLLRERRSVPPLASPSPAIDDNLRKSEFGNLTAARERGQRRQ